MLKRSKFHTFTKTITKFNFTSVDIESQKEEQNGKFIKFVNND
jgi:hypothetical protein